MEESTTIKLKKDFTSWLGSQGIKGDTYQDVVISIINDLSPEKLEEYIKRGGYSYQETARLFGIRIKK
ncbi:MAG: hypothetical protein IH845_05255 [Nanoarchaeota archaeon]|nr:hypothetical protein [Nanoarchaeota archaeon]